MNLKYLRATSFLILSLTAFSAHAQIVNAANTQNAIIAALPSGVSAEKASVDEIAQAATTLAFNMQGDLENNLTQVTIALGELTKAGVFENAPRFGTNNPAGRFYTKVLNMASSNPDVSSSTYYSLTVQDITRLTAAVREGMNITNGAKSNAITRK